MGCSAPLRRNVIFTFCVLLLCLILATAAKNQDTTTPTSRYPNELPEFRFYESASWRSLVPLVSTMNDVRRVLGSPKEAHDVSEYTKPYPGDETAWEPVFTYELNGDWKLLVYFARYCSHNVPKNAPGDRLCSIDLLPRRPLAFDPSRLPKTFAKAHIRAVDAAWDEYSDGTGLRYEVYTTHTIYGSEKPGDLNRISYGPPKPSPSEK